jgi:DNA-binding transcriptional MocR family regulator
MCSCLEEAKTLGLDFRKPSGGVYLWCKLCPDIDYRQLYMKTTEKGVSFIPGNVFYIKGSKGDNYIRLNYSYPSRLQIEKGIKILTEAIRESKETVEKRTVDRKDS